MGGVIFGTTRLERRRLLDFMVLLEWVPVVGLLLVIGLALTTKKLPRGKRWNQNIRISWILGWNAYHSTAIMALIHLIAGNI